MATSFKRTLIAAALLAPTFAATVAEAQCDDDPDYVWSFTRNGDLLWACADGADQLWSFHAYTPPPRAAYQPPPDPRPMDEGPFRALVAAVRNQSFSDSQVTVIQQAVTRNYFRVGQIVDLIELVAFSASKLRVLELGAPRVVDPENAFAVYDAFAFSADKAQARQILRRNGF
jgi:Domain of unknown function (DUF4476)